VSVFLNLPGETEEICEVLRIVHVLAETRTWSLQNRSPKRYRWKRILVYVRTVADMQVRTWKYETTGSPKRKSDTLDWMTMN